MKPNRSLTFALLLSAVLGLTAAAAAGTPAERRPDVTVMTWNLYFGFDEAPLLTASPEQIPGLVTEAWQQIQATDFRIRARCIVKKIVAAKPDLIGLNEAMHYELLDLSGPQPAVVDVVDYVEILLAELADAGLTYEMTSVTEETDVTLPDSTGTYLHLLDRDVILACRDRHRNGSAVVVSNPQGSSFQTLLTLCLVPDPEDPSGCLVPLTVKRGWASVDVIAGSESFRFVTAHLEDVSPDGPPELQQLQLAQAYELLAGPLATPEPVVLVGDFNSDGHAGWPTYRFLTDAPPAGGGLKDAWRRVHPRDPGLTWGQAPDLLNPYPTFTQRLDFVFLQGPFRVVSARVVGDERGDRAANGLWPSDHAGVVVTLVP